MKWYEENKASWVKMAESTGLYTIIIAASATLTARRLLHALREIHALEGAYLGTYSDADLKTMIRACRDHAGIEALGPPSIMA